jgi:hypothetical protein
MLRALTGRKFPGGCLDCSAFQELYEDDDGGFTLRTFHDDGCPVLTAWRRRGGVS